MFEKLKIFENFGFFSCFQKFSKTRNIFVRTLYSARAHKISHGYLFWFPYYSSGKITFRDLTLT